MRATPAALLLLAVWIVALAALGVVVERRLDVDSDLRLFLPSPTTREQRLLLGAIGEGPAARVLVVELSGAPPEALAATSRALADALRDDTQFRFVANGEAALEALPEDLAPYRYLLARDDAARAFDRDGIHAALEARARDLASPAGFALEPLIARDPTLVLLGLLDQWRPPRGPHGELDVWFDARGERALLLAETRAPAFDPAAQRLALDALQRSFAGAAPAEVRMNVGGTGRFAVLMEARTRDAAENLARTATIGMLIVLLLAYRRFSAVLASALPLVSAGIAGLAAVGLLFGTVHGITLAFGFTLIGVAQDYPLHLLSHGRPGVEPIAVVRGLGRTLATGIASTCIAYLTFWFSGVTGLQQLACFTVTGLAVAGLTTRFVLPRILAPGSRDYGASPALARLWRGIAALPRPRFALPALAAICVGAAAFAPQPFWESDLSALTPVPGDLLARDAELRAELGTADARHLLVVEANTADAALERLGSLDARLEALAARGAIATFDHAARYVPAAAVQRARQTQLPTAEQLGAELDAAVAGTAFRRDAFAEFSADVERARTASPLTFDAARSVPAFGAALDALLFEQEGSYVALVTFGGVRDDAPLRALAAADSGLTFLDVKAATESLVAEQRARLLVSLSVAFVLLIGVVSLALRDARRVYRVLAPLAATTLIVVAVLQVAGVSLNLFHLISLILAAGLGLDYALFFEHAADDAGEQGRTLHAILACSGSTLLVFVLLALADLPVLRAIGLPVAIGVVANFVLALVFTRDAAPRAAR